MILDAQDLTLALLAVAAVGGAVAVALTRDMTRLIIGLGVFLLATAGLFRYLGMPALAVAQVFVYVGGVLVLFIFAIMLLRRGEDGRPEMGSRHGLAAAAVSGGLFVAIVTSLWGRLPAPAGQSGAGMSSGARLLVGDLLPALELAGVLLLVALLAALTVVGRADE